LSKAVEGATIRIDGQVVGRSPLGEPLRLSPGEHQIEVTLDGYEPARVNARLVPRDETTRKITLQQHAPEPAPAAQPEPTAPSPLPDRGSSTLSAAGWVTVGTGAILLTGGAVTGIWALSVDGDLKDQCASDHCPDANSADIDRLGTLTTHVLLGVGLTAAAAGVVMLLLDPPSSEQPADQAAVRLSLGPGFVGATVQQRF
jgi:hypothetical protein